MGLFWVEPLVAVYSFSIFLFNPVAQQYVYWRLWQMLPNTTTFLPKSSSSCTANSSNQSLSQEVVQKQASLFSLYSGITTILSFGIAVILVASGDQRGRRLSIITPIIGTLLNTLYILMVSYFELNVYLLLLGTFISSLFGGFGSFVGGSFSYVTDLCNGQKMKTLRMSMVEMVLGTFAGIGALSSGYFIRAAGFNWPFITCALCQCCLLFYAIFILEETVETAPSDAGHLGGVLKWAAIKRTLRRVYKVFSEASYRHKTTLGLMMAIIVTSYFAFVGGFAMILLYELKEPLCFNEVWIGWSSAMSSLMFPISFVGVYVLTHCRISQLVTILLGILSITIGLLLVALSKTTLMIFMARLAMSLSSMPFPVLRTMMSGTVPHSEQGALFAWISCLETLSGSVAGTVFAEVYSATVAWYPSFIFLLAAGISLIPLVLLGVLWWLRVNEDAEEVRAILSVSEEEQGAVSE
ncbi:solute carrier family 46 member 3 [Thalassophryne amazonica]|uniref:solute carrier family 46 member 3 n=1 Tax=Thalassophryne amazonica TaxID=390379 RepID=UPI001470B077|nr:solute carrier family 46 member 3 [Thalassophryne amazonica]XP_034034201.1 solute carrier family 46 member 3 [Thalassophryne amazonica]